MASTRSLFQLNRLSCMIIAFALATVVLASNDCQPVTWQPGQYKRAVSTTASLLTSTSEPPFNSSITVSSSVIATSSSLPLTISPLITNGSITTAQVNCRYSANTRGMDINYYTCTVLAKKYGITVGTFFQLNPEVARDCSNIQANTDYCVDGCTLQQTLVPSYCEADDKTVIEPLRATNGLCGPPNGNATCLGTEKQCCNANTFTCGNSTADCAPGTCYEGACAGDSVFSTTGECGRQHGYKDCAGVWGDCCNGDGQCGTGPSFCAYGICQLGNCSAATPTVDPPGGLSWTSTDGTCGGPFNITCNDTFGNCCNKAGYCGSDDADCGQGCQPLYGSCAISSSKPPSTSPHSTLSDHSASVSGVPITSSTPLSLTKHTTTTHDTKTSTTTSHTGTSHTATISHTTTTGTAIPGESALPSCGRTCFNNMLAQYSSLGCHAHDAYCLCSNPNFNNGIRDCSNGACGTKIASTVIAFGHAYCSTASATHTPTGTGLQALPSCGQTCWNNMLGQHSQLGCSSSANLACLCENINFSNGLRDCSNGACGTSAAVTVIAYGSSVCAEATAKV